MRMVPLIFLLVALAFLAATGAGVFPWTVCVTALLLGAGALLAAVQGAACEAPPSDVRRGRPGVWPVQAAIILFLLLTAVPLPRPLTVITGRERFRQNSQVASVLREAESQGIGPQPARGYSITRNRAGTLRMAVLVIACFFAAAISAAMSAGRKAAWARIVVLAGAGLGAAGYIAQWHLPQGDTLWWRIPIPHALPGPVTCFINRNHYAGFLAFLAPVALALAVRDGARRQWVGALTSLAALTVLTLAVALALSRGAAVAMLAGLAVTALLFAVRGRAALAAVLILMLCAAAAGRFLTQHPLARERLQSLRDIRGSESFVSRMAAWQDSLRVWRAYPLLGAGANAIRCVYPQFRTTSAREYTTHVENEYVELLAEGGLVGAFLAVLLIAAVAANQSAAAGGGAPDRALRLGILGAVCAAGVHAMGEFALHSPLYAICLASLVGVTVSGNACFAGGKARALAPAAGLLLLAALCLFGREMTRLDSPRRMASAELPEAGRALVWAPTSPEAWYRLGDALSRSGGDKAVPLVKECLDQAGACDPNNYRLWLGIGHFRLAAMDYRGAREAFARVVRLRPWMSSEIPPVPEE